MGCYLFTNTLKPQYISLTSKLLGQIFFQTFRLSEERKWDYIAWKTNRIADVKQAYGPVLHEYTVSGNSVHV